MTNTKQVILVRTDLNMRKGKIAAQVAHASMKVFFDKRVDNEIRSLSKAKKNTEIENCMIIDMNEDMWDWSTQSFTKIVLGVETESDLHKAFSLARERNLPVAMITDAGVTEFHGIPTNTAVAIGPAKCDVIDEITGKKGLIRTRLL